MKSKSPIFHFPRVAFVSMLVFSSISQNCLALQDSGLIALSPTQSAQSSQPSESETHNFLLNAIQALEGRLTISARVRYEVNMFGQRLVGSGIYLEDRAGPCPLIRLELRTQLREKPSSFLRVCDGRYLWTYRNASGDVGTLNRVDVAKVARAMSEANEIHGQEWIGLGGLPRLLRSLEANFRFETFEKVDLGLIPVQKLRGRWREKKLAEIFGRKQTANKKMGAFDLGSLPKQLPDSVTLFVGRDDLFPYRIEYLRTQEGDSGVENRPIQRRIVVMELFEVNLNVPIARNRFIYNPGELAFSDQTATFIEKLGLKKKRRP